MSGGRWSRVEVEISWVEVDGVRKRWVNGLYPIIFISVMLRTGCNEIASGIVNCRTCLMAKRE